jgi:hypothetical protein
MYSTASVLATIERILGLAPLSQYDERAPRMDFEFSGPFDPTPYAARPEVFSPDEENAPGSPMASESRRLDLSREDEEPEDLLNDILYAAIQGRQAPAPVVRYGVR